MKTDGVERRGRFRRMKRCYRIIVAVFSVVIYAAMAPFGYLAFTTLALIPTRDPIRRAHRLQNIMRRAFALMHHWLRWVRILDCDPRQLRGAVADGPCVVVANHPALDDAATIMGGIPRLCTAVNRRTFHRWWLRPLLEQAGQFSGGVHNPLGSATVLEHAAERLGRGFRVLVFPEGARSPPGQLRRFARGAFEIACRVGVPVVPILIRADPLWLKRGDTVLLPPADLPKKRLEVLETLHPADFAGDSRRMRDYAEAMYSRALGAPVAALPSTASAAGREPFESRSI
jgi:1-acyl-sn-glycerol-3-phosphate acyltransferase